MDLVSCTDVSHVVGLEKACFPGLLSSVVLSKTRRGSYHSVAKASLSIPAKDELLACTAAAGLFWVAQPLELGWKWV